MKKNPKFAQDSDERFQNIHDRYRGTPQSGIFIYSSVTKDKGEKRRDLKEKITAFSFPKQTKTKIPKIIWAVTSSALIQHGGMK